MAPPLPENNRREPAGPIWISCPLGPPSRLGLFLEREFPWRAGSAYPLDPALRVFLPFVPLAFFAFVFIGGDTKVAVYFTDIQFENFASNILFPLRNTLF